MSKYNPIVKSKLEAHPGVDTIVYYSVTTAGSFEKIIMPINDKNDELLSRGRALRTLTLVYGDLLIVAYFEVDMGNDEYQQTSARIQFGALGLLGDEFVMSAYVEAREDHPA